VKKSAPMARRKEQALKKLIGETSRLQEELDTLNSCKTSTEACDQIAGFVVDSAHEDYLIVASMPKESQTANLEPNPYHMPPPSSGGCNCAVM